MYNDNWYDVHRFMYHTICMCVVYYVSLILSAYVYSVHAIFIHVCTQVCTHIHPDIHRSILTRKINFHMHSSHTCMYIYRPYAIVHEDEYVHVHIHTYIHEPACIYVHVQICMLHILLYIYIYIYIYIHTYIHACIHTYINAYVLIRTHKLRTCA
jgi:hypothetical protein